MKDENKTKERLIDELADVRQRVTEEDVVKKGVRHESYTAGTMRKLKELLSNHTGTAGATA